MRLSDAEFNALIDKMEDHPSEMKDYELVNLRMEARKRGLQSYVALTYYEEAKR